MLFGFKQRLLENIAKNKEIHKVLLKPLQIPKKTKKTKILGTYVDISKTLQKTKKTKKTKKKVVRPLFV